ncbi:uncharacterized protein NEMAJ01_0723 [Nematocida major]|uniref:uncharacterized protein n=1 Tax=Nematocida major TaxID=1912982 RepID=UPI0020083F91|nr:uncharacterized protein NEMAJ01_0723 [Nematocida major]KAH9385827.1 hypothetical protein NEMAJ01_0723 [Nematocida major]
MQTNTNTTFNFTELAEWYEAHGMTFSFEACAFDILPLFKSFQGAIHYLIESIGTSRDKFMGELFNILVDKLTLFDTCPDRKLNPRMEELVYMVLHKDVEELGHYILALDSEENFDSLSCLYKELKSAKAACIEEAKKLSMHHFLVKKSGLVSEDQGNGNIQEANHNFIDILVILIMNNPRMKLLNMIRNAIGLGRNRNDSNSSDSSHSSYSSYSSHSPYSPHEFRSFRFPEDDLQTSSDLPPRPPPHGDHLHIHVHHHSHRKSKRKSNNNDDSDDDTDGENPSGDFLNNSELENARAPNSPTPEIGPNDEFQDPSNRSSSLERRRNDLEDGNSTGNGPAQRPTGSAELAGSESTMEGNFRGRRWNDGDPSSSICTEMEHMHISALESSDGFGLSDADDDASEELTEEGARMKVKEIIRREKGAGCEELSFDEMLSCISFLDLQLQKNFEIAHSAVGKSLAKIETSANELLSRLNNPNTPKSVDPKCFIRFLREMCVSKIKKETRKHNIPTEFDDSLPPIFHIILTILHSNPDNSLFIDDFFKIHMPPNYPSVKNQPQSSFFDLLSKGEELNYVKFLVSMKGRYDIVPMPSTIACSQDTGKPRFYNSIHMYSMILWIIKNFPKLQKEEAEKKRNMQALEERKEREKLMRKWSIMEISKELDEILRRRLALKEQDEREKLMRKWSHKGMHEELEEVDRRHQSWKERKEREKLMHKWSYKTDEELEEIIRMNQVVQGHLEIEEIMQDWAFKEGNKENEELRRRHKLVSGKNKEREREREKRMRELAQAEETSLLDVVSDTIDFFTPTTPQGTMLASAGMAAATMGLCLLGGPRIPIPKFF